MTIYENNKQLLTTMGGDTTNLATDFEVRKAILDALGGDSSMCSNIYEVDLQILKIFQEGGGAGGEKAKVKSLTVSNDCIVDGTWNAAVIDTSNVTNMYNMFSGCASLQSIDVSNWNTSNVTSMLDMFENCTSLQSIDVSNWNTSNVTNMNYMFSGCTSLQSIDVSNWNTSNVTNMGSMFMSCRQLQSIYASNWNTSNVTNMNYMFSGCTSLQSIDVSNWNTSNVTNINYMFIDCKNLTTLIGGRTIDEVISNNISALNGLKITAVLGFTIIDRASLLAIINGLADLTGSTSQTLNLGSTLTAKLTTEDIAIATAKNWTIS